MYLFWTTRFRIFGQWFDNILPSTHALWTYFAHEAACEITTCRKKILPIKTYLFLKYKPRSVLNSVVIIKRDKPSPLCCDFIKQKKKKKDHKAQIPWSEDERKGG